MSGDVAKGYLYALALGEAEVELGEVIVVFH